MDENRSGGGGGVDVEVVVAATGDGQIPHPAVVLLRDDAAIGDRGDAVSGLEVLALFQLACTRCVAWSSV